MKRVTRKTVMLAAAIAVLSVGGWLWWQSGRAEPREWVFHGPAYLPTATSNDLRAEILATANAILAAYPDRTDSLAVAARVEYSLGHTDAAKTLWLRAARIDPEFANAFFALGKIAKDEADHEQAAKMLRRAIDLAPSDPHSPPLLAESLMESRQFDEAIEVLRRYMQSGQSTPKAVLNLGHSYWEKGELENARATFEVMAESYPDEPSAVSTANYSLFRVYTRLGETEKAEACRQKFLKYKPKDTEIIEDSLKYRDIDWLRGLLVKTLWECGQAYRQYGDDGQAEEAWQKAAHLDPAHSECRTALLQLYDDQQRHHDGVLIAEQLCQIAPMNPDYWRNVGVLNGRLGRLQAARGALERAIELDPGNRTYREIHEMLR